jgi:hypothetical protein
LPPGEDRDRREIEVRTTRARTLLALLGATPEVEAAYAGILERFSGRAEPWTYPILRDLTRLYVQTNRVEEASEVGRQMLALGAATGDPGISLDGHLVVGVELLFRGDVAGSLAQLDAGIASFESPAYRPRSMRIGTDPRISTLTTSAFATWLAGRPDSAAARADRAVALGREVGPYSLVYALFHAGFLQVWRSEPIAVHECAHALLDALEDHDFPLWRALGTALLGASDVFLGKADEGLARVELCVAAYRRMRTPPVFWVSLRQLHAGCLAAAGRLVEAAEVLDEVLPVAAGSASAAPLLLLRGQVSLGLGDPASAMRSIDETLRAATEMDALMVMLQAQTWQTRIRRMLGDADDGAALRRIAARFTDGFDSPDFRAAQALLAEGPGEA